MTTVKVIFGFGLDGANWAPGAALGEIIVGPQAMTSLLATRLGLNRPETDQLSRIFKYRQILESQLTADSWIQDSFQADSWTVARQLLGWRDEIIAAGVDLLDPQLYAVSARLDGLIQAEKTLKVLPGQADLLREIAQSLDGLLTQGWDLDIEHIAVVGKIEKFPRIWRSILNSLNASEIANTCADSPDIAVIEAEHEYEAADFVVQYLNKADKNNQQTQLLLSQPTDVLDSELLRAGLAPVGTSRQSVGGAQVLISYLSALISPDPIPDLVSLFLSKINAQRLFPYSTARLLNALGREYGFGATWSAALDEQTREVDQHFVKGHLSIDLFTGKSRLADPDQFSAMELANSLDWLCTQLERINATSQLAGATHLQQLLRLYPAEISRRELNHLIREVSTEVSSWSVIAAAQPMVTTTTEPAQINAHSDVLWWGALAETSNTVDPFTLAEYEAFDGAVLSSKEQKQLEMDTQLWALRQAKSIYAVIPRQRLGAKTSFYDPLLMLLLEKQILAAEEFKKPAHDLLSQTRVTPDITRPVRPNLLEAAFRPGKQLLPESLSYSQLDTLLSGPLEWLLDRQLAIRTGRWQYLSSGNALLGTVLHRVIEKVYQQDNPTADYIAEATEQAIRETAVALLAPGQQTQRQRLISTAQQSITRLIEVLDAQQLRIIGTEEERIKELVLSINGETWSVDKFVAYLDLHILDAQGKDGVIDSKYTMKKNKFQELINNDEALQLAVYAWIIGFSTVAVTAYYDLRAREFIPQSAFERTELLWKRAVNTLEQRLSAVANGKVDDPMHEFYRAHPNATDSQLKKTRLEFATSDGFIPDSFRYRDFDVLTGLKGDYR